MDAESTSPDENFAEEQRAALDAMKLPQAPVDRIVKEVLPAGFHAQKEVRVAFARALSIFIVCLGTSAQECAQQAKRKGIVLKDVSQAVAKMQLELPEIRSLVQNFKQAAAAEKAAAKTQRSAANTTANETIDADATTAELNDETAIADETNDEVEAPSERSEIERPAAHPIEHLDDTAEQPADVSMEDRTD
ncbi:DNA polymerase epsilon subunit 3 [Aphelenchoides fujianensis]|nr:DNA polymerase epsilon subunit 3 [Aphelenchoides fujianensis]